jgi:hypothetical protein
MQLKIKKISLLILTAMAIGMISVSAQNYEWAFGIGGAGDQNSMDMATDSLGNVYLIGNLQGTAFLNSFGGTDIFYAQYSIDVTGIEDPKGETGMDIIPDRNYPNPAGNKTYIGFCLLKEQHITLKISNLFGKELKMLMNEMKVPGRYLLETNVSDLRAGIYLYSITSNDFVITKKLMVVK